MDKQYLIEHTNNIISNDIAIIREIIDKYIQDKNFWRKITFRKQMPLLDNEDIANFILDYKEFIKKYTIFKSYWNQIRQMDSIPTSLRYAFYVRALIILTLLEEQKHLKIMENSNI